VPIRFPKKSRRNVVRQSSDGAVAKRSTRVRLRPRADWHKRNFLTSVLIPSLFVKRAGRHASPPPQFPKIREVLEQTALNCPVHKSLPPEIDRPTKFFWEG
jgi:hypothetical protein